MAVQSQSMISHPLPLLDLVKYENNVVLIDVTDAKSDPVFKAYLEIKTKSLFIFQKTSETEWQPVDETILPFWNENKASLIPLLNARSLALNDYDQALLECSTPIGQCNYSWCDFKPFTLIPDNESRSHLMFPAQLYLLFATSVFEEVKEHQVKILYLNGLPYHQSIEKEKASISSVIIKRESESLLLFNAIDGKDAIVFALPSFELLMCADVQFSMSYQTCPPFRASIQSLLSQHVYELHTSNLLFHTMDEELTTCSLWLSIQTNQPERFNTKDLLYFQDEEEEVVVDGEKYINLSHPQRYFVLKTNFYMIFKRQPIDFLLSCDQPEEMPSLLAY